MFSLSMPSVKQYNTLYSPRKNICVILLSSSQSNKNMSAFEHISVCVFVCYCNHLGNV